MMERIRSVFFLLLFGILAQVLWGQQTKIDSLLLELPSKTGKEKGNLLNEIAFQYRLLNQPDQAEKFSKDALEIALALGAKDLEGLARKNLGGALSSRGKFEEAMESLETAIHAFEETENYSEQINVYINLSNLYLSRGDLSNMHDQLTLAQNLSKKYDILSVPLLGSLSNFYQLVGMYQKSTQYDLESLKYAEEIGDKEGVALAYNTIGGNYGYNGQPDEAREAYEKAAKLYAELGQTHHVASIYSNLGSLLGNSGSFDQGLSYCKKALKLKRELENPESTLFTLLAMGDIYFLQRDLRNASKYYNEGLDLAEKHQILHLLAQFQNKSAIMLCKSGKLDQAYELLDQSNELAEKSNLMGTVASNYLFLSKIDSARGNFQEAYQHFRSYSSTNESIYNQAKSRQIEEMNARFETEKKEQEINLLQEKLSLEKKRSILAEREEGVQRILKNVAIAGVLVIIVILILIFNRMRIRKKLYEQREELISARQKETTLALANEKLEKEQLIDRQKLKEEALKSEARISQIEAEKLKAELDHKNRELSSAALAAMQKNDLLAEIDKKVKELEKAATTDQDLRSIKHLVGENLNLNRDWENFRVHFESVHPDFYKKLSAQFSDLSQNDLKHCTYIKVKLSSKEIARIMNISPKSVQMSRYRLKKKFNLGPDQDLFEFIELI